MYIQEVISYKGSWNTCKTNYNNELIEIMDALSNYINGHVKIENEENNFPRRVWDKALYDKGWEIIDRMRYTPDGRKVNIGPLGPSKN